MSLRDWDRKAEALESEINSLMNPSKLRHQGEEEMARGMKALKAKQFRLERSLVFVSSLVRRKQLLSLKEKTLLHWASDYIKKTNSYYQEYLTALNTLLWAKLVESRSLSITNDSNAFQSADLEGSKLKSYQQELQRSRSKLQSYLESLWQKKAQLRERYEALVVCHINDQAQSGLRRGPGKLSPVAPHVLKMKESLARQGAARAGEPLTKMDAETKKLARLISAPRRAAKAGYRKQADGQLDIARDVNKVDSLLQQFDYMNLERDSSWSPPPDVPIPPPF